MNFLEERASMIYQLVEKHVTNVEEDIEKKTGKPSGQIEVFPKTKEIRDSDSETRTLGGENTDVTW